MKKQTNMSAELNDSLTQALGAIQQLRACMTTTLQELAKGIESGRQKETEGSRQKETESGGQKETNASQQFMITLEENVHTINRHFATVEKHCTLAAQIPQPQNVAHSFLLALDPVADKSPLYTQLVNAYKWSSKTGDIAGHATAILNSNSLRRPAPYNTLINKRQRKPASTSHTLPAHLIDPLILNWTKSFTDLTITITRPLGNPAILKITILNVLHAAVVLRGLLIENVIVRGFGEESNSHTLKEEVWTKSRYEVFQKVTDHANSAMQHFYSPQKAELSIKSFLTWLHSYRTLFSQPCKKCNKFLLDNLPPTWRDNRTVDPYHESCRL